MRATRRLVFLATLCFVLTAGSVTAQTLIGPSPYLCFDSGATAATGDCANADSPFKATDFTWFYLKDYEDEVLEGFGVTLTTAACPNVGVGCPLISTDWFSSTFTDSVDEDDGAIDGLGQTVQGRGRSVWGKTFLRFTFDAAILGGLPTHVGVVWTDGGPGWTLFRAWDENGALLAQRQATLEDGSNYGTTADDHFFGIIHAGGISAIQIANETGGIEIDHLQYGTTGASGQCGGDTGLTCAAGQFCKLPVGVCDPAAQGVCVELPLDCPPSDFGDWVCGCDGVEYDTRCHADLAGVSLSRPGPCSGLCASVWGIPCLEDEYCEIPMDRECPFDLGGTCKPRPTECPEHCRPVCGCDGITYRTPCDAYLNQASTAFAVPLARYGACGEGHGLRFLTATEVAWEPVPGATGYNVYLDGDLLALESNGPVCEAAGLPGTTWYFPDEPLPGQLWEIEVTPALPEGEGAMGVGSLCRPRSPGQACSQP